MIKPVFRQPRIFSLIVVPVLMLSVFCISSRGLQTGDIVLQQERLNFTPKEFYVADVIDERSDRNSIGTFLSSDGSYTPYPVDFQGGFGAIKQYIDAAIEQNATLHPILVRIKAFRVTESQSAGGMVAGTVKLAVSFELQQGESIQNLIDYTGNANYTRNLGPPQDIEPTLRKMLGSSLEYFNNWINKQAASDIRLAKSVSVSFTDYNEKPEGDTIYYSVKRPITWNDFRGGVPNSHYAAEVSPIIGYAERIDVKNGIIQLDLEIKVCLPKSACWVKNGSRDDYTLNHEQRHFDLAKIAAMHFIQKIKSEELPVSNYDGPINVDYLDAYRQMDTLETRYDKETTHGLDHFAQEKWNERIDRELKELGVK